MGNRGFSLMEMVVVMAISVVLTAAAMPLFSATMRDNRFQAFASEFTGNLIMAREYAQHGETSVKLIFEETADSLYRCEAWDGPDRWRLLSQDSRSGPYRAEIRNQLLAGAMPHPTQDRTLSAALSSTHGSSLIFGARGSSSATIVFSDGQSRALCAVVSGQTGRFRVFLWRNGSQSWRQYF